MIHAPVDGLEATRQLMALAGRTAQPLHQQLVGIAACADRLATATRAWPTFAPRAAVLDSTIATTDGLARALRELRATLIVERDAG